MQSEHAPAGHGHTHAHGPAAPASQHTRRLVTAVLIPTALATLVGLAVLWPGEVDKAPASTDQRAYAEVLKVAEEKCPPADEAAPGGSKPVCGKATVKITEGPGKGEQVTLPLPSGPGAPALSPDDEVVLVLDENAEAGAPRYTIIDHQRSKPLLWLLALAAAATIAFGRWRGLAAIGGLAVSFAVLLFFIVPGILTGGSPLLIAVVGSAAIMFAVLYLTHGVNVHTSVAILGTLASLVLTGLLGAAFTALTQLTGLAGEDTIFLSAFGGGIDMRGLLLAGIVIGSLGVLDDVTVTQAATVAELARTPQPRWELYRAATRIGRAHVGSAVNTIVLAYAGASLPLLLLLTAGNQPVGELLTGEFLGQEIVRSAVGTIGLIASVPITTALAVLVADGRVPLPRRRLGLRNPAPDSVPRRSRH